MKLTKLALLITGALVISYSQLSFAVNTPLECRSVEYAKLERFNKKDLERKYCNDFSAWRLAYDLSSNANDAAQKMLDTGYPARAIEIVNEAENNRKVASDCANEMERTARALKRIGIKNTKCK
ncbi:MAG: hypothetical protein PHD37_07480 [Gallionellaceae bacterium]|nr:hypothetical protein [Gallionellaceae bacterium]